MRITLVAVLYLMFALTPVPAEEGAGASVLRQFLEDTVSLRANFAQRLYTAESDEPQISRGVLMVKRPGRFRWEYTEPTEQLVVCDGQKLWMYDPDLEQVTVRPVDETLRGTPAMLLSGQASLDETFHVLDSYVQDDIQWVSLQPIAESPEFESLRIGLRQGVLSHMELIDSLGQVTRIDLSDVIVGGELGDDLFRFEPPAGADVIGQGDEL